MMQASHPTGMTMYCQHHDRDDSNPRAASGVTPAGAMVEPGCSTTSATAGEASDSETRATGIQADHCHVGSQDHPDASGGESEGHDSRYYPLTLPLGGWSRKPRRSFSEPDLLSATCESNFMDKGSDMVEPPVVRRCETFTRHMLRQLDAQASDYMLPAEPGSGCEMRVEAQASGRAAVCGQKQKETLQPYGSSFAVKQQQKRKGPSAGSGCHRSLSVTGRRYGPHLLHRDAPGGSAAAIGGCELDASLNASPSASTRTTCEQAEERMASGRSLADVVALWEEFLTGAFN